MTDLFSRIDPGWLIFIGVFLGMLLLVEGTRQVLSRRETDAEARTRRMRMLAKGTDARERLELLAPQRSAGSMIGRIDFDGLLVSAGLPPKPMTFILGAVLATATVTLVAEIAIGLLPALLFAVALCIVLPFLILVAIRDRRQAKLAAQLPDALDLMARGLRAGHPLSTSIATVAETMPDPIGTEFGIMVDQLSYGDDMQTAVHKLAARNPTEDFTYLAASISIQHGTGGNLGNVLTILSKVMRDRAMMRRKIKAMSAEGRISALILSAIPFLMVGLNSIITPEYYGGVTDDPMFIPLTILAIGLILTNALVLYRLVNFKI